MPPLVPRSSSSENTGTACNRKPPVVRFSLDQNQVQLIPMIEEMSSQEMEDSYYTLEDYKKIKTTNTAILRKVKKWGRCNSSNNNTKKKNSEEYCLRGLEHETHKEERQARHQKVQSTLFAEMKKKMMLMMQQKEERPTEEQEESLAKKVANESRVSKEEALARAQADAEAVI